MRNIVKKVIKYAMFIILIMVTTACKNINTENNSNMDESKLPIEGDKLSTDEYDYLLEIEGSSGYEISDTLYGLFLEDINYAIDGGMYAEKIKNRSFEFGSMATNSSKHGWNTLGEISFEVIDGSLDKSFLNENNPNYARLTNDSESFAGIANEGFLDGISTKEHANYDFSGYFRSNDYKASIIIKLQDDRGNVYGESVINDISREWQKYESQISTADTITDNLKLYVLIDNGTVEMDMISLFPRDTYKGRKNGIRKDIGEMLEALSPKFLRFPGGCIVEGKTLENAYDWKASIGYGAEFIINGEVSYGDIATRPLGVNLWGNPQATKNPYYMTYGTGFYEFFLLCEDLGAEPVPIVNAGMSCQIQGSRNIGTPAIALEIDSDEFNTYVQDALDLIEFANGDSSTKWGAIRIAMGHENPFNVKYLGIGNEQWGDVYFSRYEAFKSAFDEAAISNPDLYGGIELIVANGPVASDRYAWKKINLKGNDYAGLVDEHYYMDASWFLTNTDRYDSYDRDSTPVFLGEYAAKANTAEAALAEAAFMTGLERNGDIVALASYAPLFGNSVAVQWTPDLIWFNNNKVWGSPNYYVQKMFADNVSAKILDTNLVGKSLTSEILSGKIGIGTWMTSAIFDNIKVVNNETNEILFSDDFTDDTLENWEQIAGTWAIENNQLHQYNISNPRNTLTGDVVYIGDEDWTNYTLTLTATKTGGSEGFLIPIAVKDKNNSYHWNIGGWANTVSCLEKISAASKSGQIASTVKNINIETGKSYEIKIVVNENSIECCLDNVKMISYKIPKVEAIYQVTGLNEDGNLVVKIVNVSNERKNIMVSMKNLDIKEENIDVSLLTAEKPSDINTEDEPENIMIKAITIDFDKEFVYNAPKYSITILHIPLK